MKKLLTVSLLAIMSVSAANAKIASTEYMAKVAGAALAEDGTIAGLNTTEKTLVPAINELKTAMGSVASNDTVTGISNRLTTAEGEIDALQTAMGTTTDVTADIAAAKKAGTDAAAAVTTLQNGQVATNTQAITGLTNTKLDASQVSESGSVGQLVTSMVNTSANTLTEQINAAAGAAAAAQETADDAAAAVEALEAGQVATNTQAITNLQTNSATKTELNTAKTELQTAINTAVSGADGKSGLTADIAAAKKAGDDAMDAVEALEAGQVATNTQAITNLQTNSATKTELNTAKQELTTAIATAKKAGDDAAAAVEALEAGQVATNTQAITGLTNTKLDASQVSESGSVGQLVTSMVNTSANTLTEQINAAAGAAAAAQETADDAAAAVEALEAGQVATNTTNITNLTNTVNDQTNGLATKATKKELGINGTLTLPTECQGEGKECALVVINGVAEWQVVQK